MAKCTCDFRFSVRLIGREVLVLKFGRGMSLDWRRTIEKIAVKAFARARHRRDGISYHFSPINVDVQAVVMRAQQDARKRFGYGG